LSAAGAGGEKEKSVVEMTRSHAVLTSDRGMGTGESQRHIEMTGRNAVLTSAASFRFVLIGKRDGVVCADWLRERFSGVQDTF
jgi:hypothetical protein